MFKSLVYFSVIILVSACAQKPFDDQPFDYRLNTQNLASLTDWQIQARISISTAEEAFSASLDWKKQYDQQRLTLQGMLGQTYARLEISPAMAQLSADGKEYLSPDPETLIYQHLGYHLPMEALISWIKAVPFDPENDATIFDSEGYLSQMKSGPWLIEYKKYKQFDGLPRVKLPSRITIKNQQQMVKLAIRDWQKL